MALHNKNNKTLLPLLVINYLRNSLFVRFFWGLMGLYLLNISVDSADVTIDYFPEDLSINDQESIIEIVIEKILGFDNLIEEHDDNDTEDFNKKKQVKIDFLVFFVSENKLSQNHFIKKTKGFPEYLHCIKNGFTFNDIPPPKI